MFGRIKRFFIALRVLRQKAREDRAIRKELNLGSMGHLARSLAPQPRGQARINTICLSEGFRPQNITEEDVKQVLKESEVRAPLTNDPVSRNKDAEQRLKEHEEKFRS